MAMELDTNHYDWANDAFTALNDHEIHQDKWSAFNDASSMPSNAFTIPPSLLTQASIERYGQITPPEELSPADPPRDPVREDSIPLEQLKNEALWPDHQIRALQNYQPQQQDSLEQSPSSEVAERSPKRRRTTKQGPANQSQANSSASQQDASQDNPQPPKRKRGRPKSQPQMVEAFTSDGYPFQVSSARQSHLEKNRVAAHKCRQRKKEYINSLEGRAREFSAKNKALKENVAMLREEVLELKNEVLRHAGCGFWAVDEYLARCAGDLLGVDAPAGESGLRKTSRNQHSPALSTLQPKKLDREPSVDSPLSFGSLDSNEPDDFGGLELLKDFDEEIDEQL